MNGGGALVKRLRINPTLRSLFSKQNVDIFCYGEALTSCCNHKLLDGYDCYLHRAYINKKDNYRRGLAIFFRERFKFLFSKVYACRKFDIVWMKLAMSTENIFFCFFYAPGDHHNSSTRQLFYDFLSRTYIKFASLGKVYLLGDTNARVGSFLNDRDINGNFVCNRNRNFLMAFLEHTGLSILNKRYQLGIPTYEIPGKKQSIIDMAFTNTNSTVFDFKILPQFLGVSNQTCHKILKLTVHLHKSSWNQDIKIPPFKRFRTPSHQEQIDLVFNVCNNITSILNAESNTSPDYFTLKDQFYKVKSNKIGFRRRYCHNYHASNKLSTIQRRYREAIDSLVSRGSDNNVFLAATLENQLHKQYLIDREAQLLNWLAEMDALDFNRRTRTFFSKLRQKNAHSETFCSITKKDGNLTKGLHETLQTWAQHYEDLYAGPTSPINFPKNLDDDPINEDFTLHEMIYTINTLKRNKSPGYDNITNDDIRSLLEELNGGDILELNVQVLTVLHNILSDFWFNECVPHDLKRTILRPFLKDSTKDASDPSNYRPISLLNTVMKV